MLIHIDIGLDLKTVWLGCSPAETVQLCTVWNLNFTQLCLIREKKKEVSMKYMLQSTSVEISFVSKSTLVTKSLVLPFMTRNEAVS